MSKIGWKFPTITGGTRRQGYTDNNIDVFKGEELVDNLAREICQNSLDAKADGVSEPVKVKFELMNIPLTKYDVFRDYKKCLDSCREYWGGDMDDKLSRFLDDAELALSPLRDTISVLVAGDFNTTGLTGSRSSDIATPWEALVNSDGISIKSDDTSGGSFGIGKNAPFACSQLSMVFYNTCVNDNEKAFMGVARLATMYNEDRKPTLRIGNYQNNDDENEKYRPIYKEDIDSFRDLFYRTERGTDVIIVGFSEEENWMRKIEKAIIKNFFVAIHENNLTIELKDSVITSTINSTNLAQKITEYSDCKDMLITAQLYTSFVYPDYHEKLTILENDDAEIYIKADSTFARTIAYFRTTGMLVCCKKKTLFQHYAAVFIVRGSKLGELLRATEPARHNKWDHTLIKGETEKEKRKEAGNALRKIDSHITLLLRQQSETVTEDSVDAAGVAEYLPDNLDDFDGASEGNDILKPKIKIGKVKKTPVVKDNMNMHAEQDEGAILQGDAYENTDVPINRSEKPNRKVIDPDDNNEEQSEGSSEGKSRETVVIPNIVFQRAYPINESIGLYKIVMMPRESYENLFVTCYVVGEDGASEKLTVKKFVYDGLEIDIKEDKAGPINISSETPSEFFVTFDSNEKMMLDVRIMEDRK